jgi:hypothetical protein
MSMKKKSAIAMSTATIVRRTITKKTISERIITINKGSTVVETDEKMQEI